MKVRRALLKDLVIVETGAGEGAYGPIYTAPVTVLVNVDQTRRLVRNAAGDEVVSEATLTVHPQPRNEATGALLDALALFTPESRVSIGGRISTVINAAANTFRGNVAFVKVMVA